MTIIGIDPDLRKSGVAVFDDVSNKLVSVTTMTMWDIFSMLKGTEDPFVILEYSTSNNTWHKGGRGASINVGKNKAIGCVLKDFLTTFKIKHVLIEPAGYSNDGDIEHFSKLYSWEGKTNADSRAAVRLLFANMFRAKID